MSGAYPASLLLIAIAGLLPGAASAEIFKCTDDAGQIRFQETPCSYQLSQEGIDEALQRLEDMARSADVETFADEVTRNALGGFSDSRGRTILMLACSGAESICRWALESGEDPHRTDVAGRKALAHAAGAGRVDNMNLLLSHPEITPYQPGDRAEALRTAVNQGQFRASLMLLETGVDPDQQTGRRPSALALAVDNGNLDLVRLLVRHGADPAQAMNGGPPVERAYRSGDWQLLSAMNPGTQKLRTSSKPISVPPPDNGWDCHSYAPVLEERTRMVLASDEREGLCFIESDRIAELGELAPLNLGLYHFSWIQAPIGSVEEAMAETARRYKRRYPEVFEETDRRIGLMKVSRVTAGGGSALVSTCAVMVTTLTDHLGVAQFCRYDETEREDHGTIQAATRLWLDQVAALNR